MVQPGVGILRPSPLTQRLCDKRVSIPWGLCNIGSPIAGDRCEDRRRELSVSVDGNDDPPRHHWRLGNKLARARSPRTVPCPRGSACRGPRPELSSPRRGGALGRGRRSDCWRADGRRRLGTRMAGGGCATRRHWVVLREIQQRPPTRYRARVVTSSRAHWSAAVVAIVVAELWPAGRPPEGQRKAGLPALSTRMHHRPYPRRAPPV